MSSQDRTELELLVRESQHQVGQLVRMLRTTLILGGVTAGAALIGVTALPSRSQTSAPHASTEAVAHAAKPQNVLVTNSFASPVPVTGTVNTNVAGTVSAQQSGLWNVGITGNPGVTLANSAGNPGIVKDVSHSARQPFDTEVSFFLDQGVGNQFQNLPQVPAGKRLVLEYITISADTQNGQQVVVRIDTDSTVTPGASSRHFFPTTRFDSQVSYGDYPTKLYIGPGSTAIMQAARTGGVTNGAGITATLSGYFEDAG